MATQPHRRLRVVEPSSIRHAEPPRMPWAGDSRPIEISARQRGPHVWANIIDREELAAAAKNRNNRVSVGIRSRLSFRDLIGFGDHDGFGHGAHGLAGGRLMGWFCPDCSKSAPCERLKSAGRVAPESSARVRFQRNGGIFSQPRPRYTIGVAPVGRSADRGESPPGE